MITTATAAPLGWNPFSSVAKVAKGVAHVVTNPAVERAATAAASAYNPALATQAQQYVSRAQGYVSQAKAILQPGGAAVVVPGHPHEHGPAPMSPVEASDAHPVRSNGMLTFGLLGAGLLVLLLVVKK